MCVTSVLNMHLFLPRTDVSSGNPIGKRASPYSGLTDHGIERVKCHPWYTASKTQQHSCMVPLVTGLGYHT